MSDGQSEALGMLDDEPETLANIPRHPCDVGVSLAMAAQAASATPNWVRAATLVGVQDGDTITVSLDLGMNIFAEQKIRLAGIAAPELNTPAGKLARDFAFHWLTETAGKLTVETVKDKREKFGRYLGIVRVGTRCLNDDLVAAGHAVKWDGTGKQPG